ncbi:MAG: hypothetical protein AB8G96_14530 [Phycisphaerales bacterium]
MPLEQRAETPTAGTLYVRDARTDFLAKLQAYLLQIRSSEYGSTSKKNESGADARAVVTALVAFAATASEPESGQLFEDLVAAGGAARRKMQRVSQLREELGLSDEDPFPESALETLRTWSDEDALAVGTMVSDALENYFRGIRREEMD